MKTLEPIKRVFCVGVFLSLTFMCAAQSNDPMYDTDNYYTPVKKQKTIYNEPIEIETGISRFEKQRSTAKAFQILGGLALTGYFIWNNQAVQELKNGSTNPSTPPSWMPVFGSGAITIGFIIDLSAGRHLENLKK